MNQLLAGLGRSIIRLLQIFNGAVQRGNQLLSWGMLFMMAPPFIVLVLQGILPPKNPSLVAMTIIALVPLVTLVYITVKIGPLTMLVPEWLLGITGRNRVTMVAYEVRGDLLKLAAASTGLGIVLALLPIGVAYRLVFGVVILLVCAALWAASEHRPGQASNGFPGWIKALAALALLVVILGGPAKAAEMMRGLSDAIAAKWNEPETPPRLRHGEYKIAQPGQIQGAGFTSGGWSGGTSSNKTPIVVGNGDAPELPYESRTLQIRPRTQSTGCMTVPNGMQDLDLTGLPPVAVQIYFDCSDETDGELATRHSWRVYPQTFRLANLTEQSGFVVVTPRPPGS